MLEQARPSVRGVGVAHNLRGEFSDAATLFNDLRDDAVVGTPSPDPADATTTTVAPPTTAPPSTATTLPTTTSPPTIGVTSPPTATVASSTTTQH